MFAKFRPRSQLQTDIYAPERINYALSNLDITQEARTWLSLCYDCNYFSLCLWIILKGTIAAAGHSAFLWCDRVAIAVVEEEKEKPGVPMQCSQGAPKLRHGFWVRHY